MHLNIFLTARRLILLFKLTSRWTGFSWLTCPGVVLYPAGEKSEPQVERLTLVPKPWRYVRSELSGNWNVTLPGLFPGVTDPGYAGLSGVPGVWNIRLSAPGVLSSALSITPGDAGVSWDNRRNKNLLRRLEDLDILLTKDWDTPPVTKWMPFIWFSSSKKSWKTSSRNC